jgi:maltose alpha-D-glucosyltransferase/alpha-amylase
MLMAHVQNSGDAWGYTLDSVIRYYERVLERRPDASRLEDEAIVSELIGGVYPERVRLLARRTGEMHLALAGETEDPDFIPEPFTTLNQRSLYQSMRGTTRRMVQQVRTGAQALPEECRAEIMGMLDLEAEILERQARLISRRSRRPAFASMGIITSGRCCTPERTSSSSTSKVSRFGRSANAG